MTRAFTVEFLTDLLNDEEYVPKAEHWIRSTATGEAWDHALEEEWETIFKFEGVYYRFLWHKPSQTYLESGDGFEPFEHLKYGTETVECDEMIPLRETVIVFEPLDTLLRKVDTGETLTDSENRYLDALERKDDAANGLTSPCPHCGQWPSRRDLEDHPAYGC